MTGAALLLCGGSTLADIGAVPPNVTPVAPAAPADESDPVVDAPEVAMNKESDFTSRSAHLDNGQASDLMEKTFDAGAASGFDKTFSGSDEESKIVMPVSNLGGKSYAVPSFRLPESEEAANRFAKPSTLSMRDSPLSSKAAHGFDRTVESKEYTGPESRAAAEEMKAMSQGLGRLEDLPDRNLSMAEVKSLLNQYTKGESKQAPVAEPVARKAIPLQ